MGWGNRDAGSLWCGRALEDEISAVMIACACISYLMIIKGMMCTGFKRWRHYKADAL
ncbi:uncharacterized protein LY89DRAFT_684651, partial [Mollisia scopiformis]